MAIKPLKMAINRIKCDSRGFRPRRIVFEYSRNRDSIVSTMSCHRTYDEFLKMPKNLKIGINSLKCVSTEFRPRRIVLEQSRNRNSIIRTKEKYDGAIEMAKEPLKCSKSPETCLKVVT